MKQYEKWLKEKLEKGIVPTSSYAWREALLWFWKTAEHLSPSDYELLEKELEDEAGQKSLRGVQEKNPESSPRRD